MADPAVAHHRHFTYAITAVAGLEVDLGPVGELCAAEAAEEQDKESPV